MIKSAAPLNTIPAALCRLLLVPFVWYQLIAPGMMVTSTDAGLEVVLCTGVGPDVTIVLETGDDPAHHGDENPCGWAVQFAATTNSPQNPPALSILAFDMDVALPNGAVHGDQRQTSSIRVRGPPVLI
ncbi:MAG: DUF2946 family protein [Yoonia sp.]|uniref:DUF2946 family protein n=1 Tax=Yoonia sp. TaxID=2212373 RepID=UPI003EFA6964